MEVDGRHLSALIAAGIAVMLAAVLAFAAPSCGRGGQPDGLVNQPQGLAAAPIASAVTQLWELPCPEDVDAGLWAELKGALEEALLQEKESRPAAKAGKSSNRDSLSTESRLESRDSGGGKFASAPPTGDANRVNDLVIGDNGDGSYTLTWHYRNLGDYGQNGQVGIEDITPLAVHFQETWEAGEEDTLPAVIDGSGNGKVGIEDVTPIAQNFGVQVADYLIEGASALEGPFSEVGTVSVDSATGGESGRAVLAHLLTPGEYSYFRVTARDSAGTPGGPSNTVGIALQILSVTPTEVKEGTVVTFSAEVLGAGPLSYVWDFGGGAQYETYTDPSPRVVLTRETGGFPASLTVTGPMGNTTYPFTLSKLAREWKYEVVLAVSDEYLLHVSDLRQNQNEISFVIGTWVAATGAQDIRLLVTGIPGSLRMEEIGYWGAFDVSPQGAAGVLYYSGAILNLNLNFAESADDNWYTSPVESGLFYAASCFTYSGEGDPYAAYLYTYWEPKRTDELRLARRLSDEWLTGVIDDGGGPGGEVLAPIIMRVDTEGNPSVAYRVVVEDRKELRLARWSSQSLDWDIQAVLPSVGDEFDFNFSARGRPSFAYADYGGSQETSAIYYAWLEDGSWKEELVDEWQQYEEPYRSAVQLTFDPMDNAVIAYRLEQGESNLVLRWYDGALWEKVDLPLPYAHSRADLTMSRASDGTPYLAYVGSDRREVILARYD